MAAGRQGGRELAQLASAALGQCWETV